MKTANARMRLPACSLAALLLFSGCGVKNELKDEAGKALDDAQRLAANGDYAGALEKHVWFHNNALAVQPSYYGVRLSFALAYWVELGKKYPPALQSLKSIRDEKTARLSSGTKDRGLFHDVVAINEYLVEQEQTVRLFKKIEASDSEFASKVYDLADAAVLASKEYELAKKHLGDPLARLARAKGSFEEGMQFAKGPGGDATRRAIEHIFTEDVVRIITVLRETGDRDGAKKIQSEALSVLNSPGIRTALMPEGKDGG